MNEFSKIYGLNVYITLFVIKYAVMLVQGSTKLEKAEILQMTVDHLKMLHAKG